MGGIAMLGLGVTMLLPLVLVIGLLVVATLPGARHTGLHKGALFARWVGIIAGGAAICLMIGASINDSWPGGRLELGALTAAAPLVGATLLVIAIWIGELTLPAPRSTTRYGLLTPRDRRTVSPQLASITACLGVLALGGYAVFTTLVAAPDTEGRPGRAIGHTGVDGFTGGAYGPFPGQWYTLPALIALAVLVAAAAGAIAVVVRRRPSADPQDILLRRRSVTSLLGAVAVGTGLTAQGLSAYGLMGFLRIAQPDYVEQGLGFAGMAASLGVGMAGLIISLLGAVMVCMPASIARTVPGQREPAGTMPVDRDDTESLAPPSPSSHSPGPAPTARTAPASRAVVPGHLTAGSLTEGSLAEGAAR